MKPIALKNIKDQELFWKTTFEIVDSTPYIEDGYPWENGYCESFDFRQDDKLLNREFLTVSERCELQPNVGAFHATRYDKKI